MCPTSLRQLILLIRPSRRHAPPYPMILLFITMQVLPRQSHSMVQRDRQPAMPPAQHDKTQHKLAASVPRPREAVRVRRDPHGDADRAVGRHDLEDDVKHGIRHRDFQEVRRLYRGDHQDRQHQPPDVMRQLPVDLLADEADAAVRVAAAAVQAARCEKAVYVSGPCGWGYADAVHREGALDNFPDVDGRGGAAQTAHER